MLTLETQQGHYWVQVGHINLGDDWQPRLNALRELAIATNQAYRVVVHPGSNSPINVIAHLHADGRIERAADDDTDSEGATH